MSPWNWQVTFHPLRALARASFACIVFAACWFPTDRVSTGSSDHVVVVKVEQMRHDTAVGAVRTVLDEKMPTLAASRRARLAEVVVDESLACGLDPLFALAVSDVESRFDHEAVSAVITKSGQPKANAKGMFQLIDMTWNHEVKRRGLSGAERFNPVDNAKVGIGYLCMLKDGVNGKGGFKRPDSLVLAYNQGPGMATAIIAGRDTGDYQAPVYGPAVWKSYRALLQRFGLPSDAKSMRQLYKTPEATIYKVTMYRASDGKGGELEPTKWRDPTAAPPVKVKPRVKTKPKPVVVEMVRQDSPDSVPVIETLNAAPAVTTTEASNVADVAVGTGSVSP